MLFLTWYKNTLSPPCFKPKAGICADAPRLCRSKIPCLSLKSVGTNTCSRTGFESRNRSCFYRTLMHRLLTKTSGSVLVAVIGGDCSNSSRLTSKDPPPLSQRWSSVWLRRCRAIPPTYRPACGCPPPPFGGSGKETMVLCEEETRAPQTV